MAAPLDSCTNLQKRIVENSTLVWALAEVPGQPTENVPPAIAEQKPYQLPLEREVQLADSFAFIAAATADAFNVPAVCVEEDDDRMGMTVRLASNSGDLLLIADGLKDIATILEQASLKTSSRDTLKRDLFKRIVVLDKSRILSRLRSRHAPVWRRKRTREKPPILNLLDKTINYPPVNPREKTEKASIVKARSQTRRLVETFQTFESMPDDPFHQESSYEVLSTLLIHVTQLDMDCINIALSISPTRNHELRTVLPQILYKLGRYHDIACDLIDAARSSASAIFKRIAIKPLQEPRANSPAPDSLANFEEVVERQCPNLLSPQAQGSALMDVSGLRDKYHLRISALPSLRKVHAEIQLLFFYEHNPHIRRPRAICSSKSACYLCNLFVQRQGKFHIPRTHGRLYDRWILPEWSYNDSIETNSMSSTINAFATKIEAKILEVFENQQLSFSHPNESVLLLRKPWPSTLTLPMATEQLDRNIKDSGKAEVERLREQKVFHQRSRLQRIYHCLIEGARLPCSLHLPLRRAGSSSSRFSEPSK